MIGNANNLPGLAYIQTFSNSTNPEGMSQIYLQITVLEGISGTYYGWALDVIFKCITVLRLGQVGST